MIMILIMCTLMMVSDLMLAALGLGPLTNNDREFSPCF